MTVLSHTQFHQLRDQANTLNPDWGNESGYSARLHRGPSGEVVHASNANMVGGVVPTTTVDAPLGSRQMVQFARSHQETLSRPEMHMGAWHEGNRQPKPQVDLDVSQAYPRTAQGRSSARTATINRNEKAYGEVDEGGGYTTHTNPFRVAMGKEKLSTGLERLRSDPAAYEAVVSGKVLSAVSDWIKR